ncbi:hypothetical protein [Bacillus sp. Marseille-Q1617]|uniref:hypothetical protein n=1 Tax=Bacillus sp. Marseille-Q1617 TaxID=2736887 RepID=UPI00158A9A6C|nr:hypothetical protein [Bacillus sp. Marseille-Q1617]
MDKVNNQNVPLLHIYPQKLPHDDVVIVSSRTALLRLQKSIENALEKGEGDCVVTTSDFERYEMKIILNDEGLQADFWRRLQLPHFEIDESKVGEILTIEDIIGFDIKNSEDLRKVKSVMEEYRKYSQEMTEKMKQFAKRNKLRDE